MKVELTQEWCMNMAKIEARAAELREGCRMPMEQARELAASESSPDWYARGQDWALADAMSGSLPNDWTAGDIARAYAAGARAAVNGGDAIERLQFALQRLADAAGALGVNHFGDDWRSDEVQELQAATRAARLVLGPNVAGNRLAEGKSELTGLLGGPTRSEKE